METKDKVSVIQANIDSLRKEIDLRIVSQNTIWRLVIIGLAAVVVLKGDIEIGRFLPLVPILGMIITAFWFTETLFLFRTGRWIASMEAQINTLIGSEILQYESTLWQQRKATVWGTNWFYVVLAIGATAAYVFLLFRFLPGARQVGIRGFTELFALAAVLSYVFAAANFYRIWSLLRQS